MRIHTYTFFRGFVFTTIVAMLVYSISGCTRLPNNGVPIYLQIDSPKVVSNAFLGSASSNIPGVWATTGSHNLGAYEMPVNIPILASGSIPIAISAGIYDNGIVNAPVEYPFYIPDTFTIPNAIAGHVYHHKPTYSYFAYTQVALNETFDADNGFTNITPVINRADSNVYEGLRSGGIVLGTSVDSLTAIQSQAVSVITNGRPAYVELNYKLPNANVLCDVGIVASMYSGGQLSEQTVIPKIVLTNPIGVWNKVYLNFSNDIGTFDTEIGADSTALYQVYFTAYHNLGQQDTVFLDNIKLLYFH
jgi:hypothetical protein